MSAISARLCTTTGKENNGDSLTTQFSQSEFDAWASSYDDNTSSEDGFPFTGYSVLLQTIFEKAASPAGSDVLDLGVGTGNLALLFANSKCKVWGLDFSAEMLKLAQAKLPSAVLGLADLRAEWPPEFNHRYDAIVSAYTFHHFPIEEKVSLVKRLINHNLNPGGKLLIGDIAFQDEVSEAVVRAEMGKEWEQEFYWLVDESVKVLASAGIPVSFHKISYCAGIFEFLS
jgi:putative AdoMet-dependent methyltransferase